MTFEELRAKNKLRCEQSFHGPIDDWNPRDCAVAMAGEAGEACNLCKKLRRGELVSTEDIAFEVADTVIYADLLCQRLGVKLEDAVRIKFDLVSDHYGSLVKFSALDAEAGMEQMGFEKVETPK